MNVALERRRLAIMVAFSSLGLAIAGFGLAVVGGLRFAWGWPVLVAGIVTGVGAQIGFIFGVFRRAGKD